MRYQRVADIDVAISRRHPYWLVVAIIMVCIVLSIVLFWRNPFQKALAPSHQHNADKDSVNTVIPVQSSDIEDSSSQTTKLPIPQMTSSQRSVSPQPQPEAHSSKPEPSIFQLLIHLPLPLAIQQSMLLRCIVYWTTPFVPFTNNTWAHIVMPIITL